MELREIEIFLALAEELHFGRTAERLHVSQARISQTIKKLERQVGAPLFDRTSRRVALTPIGAGLRDDLAPAYRQIVGGVARATDAGRGTGGVLRLGFEAPGVADLVTDVLDAYRSQRPDSDVQVREADFRDPFGLLRGGEVDAMVTLLPVTEPDLTAGPVVLTEPMVLAVPMRHPFSRLDSVTLDDLARDTVFRAARPAPPYWVEPPEPWTTPAGHPVRRGRVLTTFQELLAAIAAGEGICPLAAHARQYFAHPRITFVPFRDAPHAEWAVVWRRAGETERVRELARVIRSRAG
ncbi:LysR family transcriptional regulator [Pseudonocardia xinjiangensis]|uniref:LysR family transcriptional regulator n=1 Tax=Pseudonocardia xinjiangensis TaxID=75289 RepID=A0ABX1RPJ4_9PSEU|nr:LysR family transcriptional regulator [Pseudonocardia xinjiangensis]NMH81756.1 LysR family transcriptional regulator [Pseudonocardia xinjiangensis]